MMFGSVPNSTITRVGLPFIEMSTYCVLKSPGFSVCMAIASHNPTMPSYIVPASCPWSFVTFSYFSLSMAPRFFKYRGTFHSCVIHRICSIHLLCWFAPASLCNSGVGTASYPTCGGCDAWGFPSTPWLGHDLPHFCMTTSCIHVLCLVIEFMLEVRQGLDGLCDVFVYGLDLSLLQLYLVPILHSIHEVEQHVLICEVGNLKR